MRRACSAVLALACAFLLACEGPMGPEGPEGPQGPPGPAGEFYMESAQVGSDGTATVVFGGLSVEGTVVTCYLSDTQSGPWVVVGTDLEGVTCGVENEAGGLRVSVIFAPTGWYFMATAATEASG